MNERTFDVMEPVDVLRKAVAAIEAADVPDDLRASALAPTIALIVGGEPTSTEGLALGAGGGANGSGSAPPPPATPGSRLGKIASELTVDEEAVRSVFHDDGEGIELVVNSSRLPQQKRMAMRDIAILMTAARQLAGYEEWTPLDLIRQVCEDHKRLDGGNFAKAMATTDGLTLRGKSRSKEARLSRAGREDARHLILQLSGV